MMPAGYERFSDDDEDEGFEFDFNDNVRKSKVNSAAPGADGKKAMFDMTTGGGNHQDDDDDWDDHPFIEVSQSNLKSYEVDPSEIILKEVNSAIQSGDAQLLSQIITSHNLDINQTLRSNWTMLMHAVAAASWNCCKYLIENGADVNFDEDSFSVILCACGCTEPSANEYNLVQIVSLLLEKGVNPDTCDKYLQTPLIYASRAGNAQLIDFLVTHGADVNAKDDNDWTALSHACHSGQLRCVQKLLRHQADPFIYTIDHFYPYDLAEKAGYFEIKRHVNRYIKCVVLDNIKTDTFKMNAFFEAEENNMDKEFKPDAYLKLLDQDLETFLTGLSLSRLIKTFQIAKVTMKELLNFGEDDFKKIGICNGSVIQLIMQEVTKFHKSNWRPDSLPCVHLDAKLNVNEMDAILVNISRHMEYMTTNVKYLIINGVECNKDLFNDPSLTATLLNDLKIAQEVSQNLIQTLDEANHIFKHKMTTTKITDIPDPMGSISAPEIKPITKWYQSRTKLSLLTTITAAASISSIYFLKAKFSI